MSQEQFVIKRVFTQADDALRCTEKEIRILALLQPHQNVCKFFGSSQQVMPGGFREILLLLEPCPGGSLFQIICDHATARKHFPEEQILDIMSDITRAIAHMHAQTPPIAHRDLKPENILLHTDGGFRLIDFGSCSTKNQIFQTREEILHEEELISKETTMAYRAPELADLYTHQLVNEKVDIWALGLIFYYLCYLKHPLPEPSKLQIINAKFLYPTSPAYSEPVLTIIKSCLNTDPTQRPSASALVKMLKRLRSGRVRSFQFSSFVGAGRGVPDPHGLSSAIAMGMTTVGAGLAENRPRAPSIEEPPQAQTAPAGWQSFQEPAPSSWVDFSAAPSKLSSAPAPSSSAPAAQAWDPFASLPTSSPTVVSTVHAPAAAAPPVAITPKAQAPAPFDPFAEFLAPSPSPAPRPLPVAAPAAPVGWSAFDSSLGSGPHAQATAPTALPTTAQAPPSWVSFNSTAAAPGANTGGPKPQTVTGFGQAAPQQWVSFAPNPAPASLPGASVPNSGVKPQAAAGPFDGLMGHQLALGVPAAARPSLPQAQAPATPSKSATPSSWQAF
eukprot:TRINITY_DN6520_c0_g1_i1.p1 TRINITY_DN6520_c0_g1~~TRINITY_DN6520_c0_g1_i1.p1  ORF type:complete len:629 (+),score=92.83 TRINITY_DN6520_c0_g1_i1:215-1888(+)